jgi:hypothetical protein
MIDATQSKADVAEQIWKTVSDRLRPAATPAALEGAAL